MANYSGKALKWDELVEHGPELVPQHPTSETVPPVVPDENGFYPIPVPGTYDPLKATA